MSGFLLDEYRVGETIPCLFHTFNGAGASITLTGLAAADIEIYKGTSMTQRASDNGYALLDTDGIDIDTRTGIHGISIDLSDDSDAGFYAAGSYYHVVIDAVTVDSQTVRFVLGAFRIVAAEAIAGQPSVCVESVNGTAVSGSGTSGDPWGPA